MLSLEILFFDNVKECRSLMAVKGTVMQTEKVLVNDCLHVSKVSWKFCIPIFFNFAVISPYTAQKMKFSIKDFFSKYDQIQRKLQIWSHILKKSLMENLIFCAVLFIYYTMWLLYSFKLVLHENVLKNQYFFGTLAMKC